jgi:hypothetical protein
MPKTKKKFNWEVFDQNGNFLDILTMSRNEFKVYQEQFPDYKLQEIGYTDND